VRYQNLRLIAKIQPKLISVYPHALKQIQWPSAIFAVLLPPMRRVIIRLILLSYARGVSKRMRAAVPFAREQGPRPRVCMSKDTTPFCDHPRAHHAKIELLLVPLWLKRPRFLPSLYTLICIRRAWLRDVSDAILRRQGTNPRRNQSHTQGTCTHLRRRELLTWITRVSQHIIKSLGRGNLGARLTDDYAMKGRPERIFFLCSWA
jgi:hypothetical protein